MIVSSDSNNYPTKENTCAIVVSYHPDSSILNKIAAIAEQVGRVVIIDNASTHNEISPLIEVSEYSDNIHLIINEENIGQAKALNIGVRYAKKEGYCWVLTMDQDSLVAPDMVEKMSCVYRQCSLTTKVASICPVLASYNGVSPPASNQLQLISFSGKKIDGLCSYIKVVITSGNLLNIDVFDRIGLFEEDFFIGYVDIEFSLRLFQAGYKAVQANKAILYHNIGDTTQHSFLGKKVLTGNNNSLRIYYFYRNGITVYKKYIFRDPAWVAQNLVKAFIFNIAKIILFESDRKGKLGKAFIGLGHGLIGKTGKYTP